MGALYNDFLRLHDLTLFAPKAWALSEEVKEKISTMLRGTADFHDTTRASGEFSVRGHNIFWRIERVGFQRFVCVYLKQEFLAEVTTIRSDNWADLYADDDNDEAHE